MIRKNFFLWTAVNVVAVSGMIHTQESLAGPVTNLTPQEQLGKHLFHDTNLSTPAGQACASCHAPQVGFTGAKQAINIGGAVYEGAVPGRFGNRKPPSAAYAGNSSVLHFQNTWIGGMFWDGRATGNILGDPLAEQAQGPFLNPLEQNNASAQELIAKVQASSYSNLFSHVCLDSSRYYECIGRSIAAYERSKEVSPFSSKYDYWQQGRAKLTTQEQQGLKLFNGKAKCAGCHVPPVFTDFTYHNIGVPRNASNPFYRELDWNPLGQAWVDKGLGGFLKSINDPNYAQQLGKQKIPTLRNVDKRPNQKFVKAYMHNGYFKSLKDVVHFYNTRDVPSAGWPAPEVAKNINKTDIGILGLSQSEELAIVAFLKTLSDGYIPKPTP